MGVRNTDEQSKLSNYLFITEMWLWYAWTLGGSGPESISSSSPCTCVTQGISVSPYRHMETQCYCKES